MGIAELGLVVILWYETDVNEKHREKSRESIYRHLNVSATLYCSSSSNFTLLRKS